MTLFYPLTFLPLTRHRNFPRTSCIDFGAWPCPMWFTQTPMDSVSWLKPWFLMNPVDRKTKKSRTAGGNRANLIIIALENPLNLEWNSLRSCALSRTRVPKNCCQCSSWWTSFQVSLHTALWSPSLQKKNRRPAENVQLETAVEATCSSKSPENHQPQVVGPVALASPTYMAWPNNRYRSSPRSISFQSRACVAELEHQALGEAAEIDGIRVRNEVKGLGRARGPTKSWPRQPRCGPSLHIMKRPNKLMFTQFPVSKPI